MQTRHGWAWMGSWLAAGLLALGGCGGGGGGTSPNQAPVPAITAPAEGSLFSGGQALNVSVSATDPEDGALAATRLLWWVNLHRDGQVQALQAQTAGAGGSLTLPTRGLNAATVFYRVHTRATDSAGVSAETTRDLQPRRARITLATVPAGLSLALDGQTVADGTSTSSIVGVERDIGAADQVQGGRRYRFTGWSDGGAASHAVAMPATDTTYTANFADIGPAGNALPAVSLAAPATATVGVAATLTASATDSDGSIVRVAFFDDGVLIGEATSAPYTLAWTPTTAGSHAISAVATDDGGASAGSNPVNVAVSGPAADTQPPVITFTAPTAFAAGLTGTLTVTADALDNVGVTTVEFQIDGVPIGPVLTAPPYRVSLDTTAHASGQHVLRARAGDLTGNVSAWATLTVSFGGNRTQPAGITRDAGWVTGLSSATAFAQARDGRLFVAQQGGALRVVKDGALLPTPFVSLAVNALGERGLLGVALHPNFASNGYVYLYYTTDQGGTHNRISRFTASGDVAVPGSEQVLVDLPPLSSASNHNGGAMHFGVDGLLYVGVGENANAALAQDLSSPMGKLLRFNDDGTPSSENPYYATQSGLARAIWARGLRNPFTFAVRPTDGRIHINDVGQASWEEINLGVAGANYGWPATEGPTSASGVTAPLFSYGHSAATPAGSGPGGFFTGAAIAGGTFYRTTGPFPAPWKGLYFFADYISSFIGALDFENGHAAYAFGSVSGNVVDLLAAADGSLLVLTRNGIVRFSVP